MSFNQTSVDWTPGRVTRAIKKRFENLFKPILKFLTISFITVFLLIVYVQKVEILWMEVVQVPMMLPHLSPELEGYRIVQITDIHADDWMTADRIANITRQINDQQPDLVVLTGDFVTGDADRYSPALKSFAQLKAPDGSIAILGNHDEATDPQLITNVLESSGVRVLQNQVVTITSKGTPLNIAGLGDALSGKDDMEKCYNSFPALEHPSCWPMNPMSPIVPLKLKNLTCNFPAIPTEDRLVYRLSNLLRRPWLTNIPLANTKLQI